MIYRFKYTTSEDHIYTIEGVFDTKRPCIPEIMRVVCALEELSVKYLKITLSESTQREAETGGIGGG